MHRLVADVETGILKAWPDCGVEGEEVVLSFEKLSFLRAVRCRLETR